MLGIATEHWELSGAMRFVGGDVLEVKAANLTGEHRMSGFVKTSSTILVYLSHSAPVSPSSLPPTRYGPFTQPMLDVIAIGLLLQGLPDFFYLLEGLLDLLYELFDEFGFVGGHI